MGTFESLEKNIETQLSSYSSSISDTLITNIFPLISAGVCIYLLLKSYLIAAGRVQEPVMETMIWGFKALVISFFALDSGNFLHYGIEGLKAFEQMMMESLPSYSTSSPSSLGAAMDNMWAVLLKLLTPMGSYAADFGIGQIALAFMTALLIVIYMISASFLTLACLGVLVTTKIVFILAAGFGPFFLSMMMFPMTRSFFDGWLKFMMTQIFTLVLLTGLVVMTTVLIDKMVNASSIALRAGGQDYYKYMAQTFGVMITTLALAVCFKQIPSMSAGIVGSTALAAAGIGQMLKGVSSGAKSIAGGTAKAVGGAAGGAASALGTLKGGGVGALAERMSGIGSLTNQYAGAKRGAMAAKNASMIARDADARGDAALSAKYWDLAGDSLKQQRHAVSEVENHPTILDTAKANTAARQEQNKARKEKEWHW